MLSRVANSIYWMSRYIERAENIARFIDVNLRLMLDSPSETDEQWQPLVDITGDEESFSDHYDASTRENVIQFLTFDRENPNSILSCLRMARENARSVREVISSEMWEQVNSYYLKVKDALESVKVMETPSDFFSGVKIASHEFVGITDSTMSHGEGWHFNRLGRLLERADKTSRLVDVKYFILLPSSADVGTTYDNIQWSALLRSASAFEMYRKRHGLISRKRIVEFLILDLEFPRAVLNCLNKANDSLHIITRTPIETFGNRAEQCLGQLRSELAYHSAEEIMNVGLHEYLDTIQTKINLVSDAIHETFFAMRPKDQDSDSE